MCLSLVAKKADRNPHAGCRPAGGINEAETVGSESKTRCPPSRLGVVRRLPIRDAFYEVLEPLLNRLPLELDSN